MELFQKDRKMNKTQRSKTMAKGIFVQHFKKMSETSESDRYDVYRVVQSWQEAGYTLDRSPIYHRAINKYKELTTPMSNIIQVHLQVFGL